jgi:hypothetical protein
MDFFKSNLSLCLQVALCFVATSCQWRTAPSLDKDVACRTISIPFAIGDDNGRFTTDLIADIERTGAFRYVKDNGELSLRVVFVDSKYENIGFRYDRIEAKEEGVKHKKRIIPDESRSKRLAEVSVIENATGKVLLGPAYILATNDYDHQNYSLSNNVNIFSLGQLTDIDTAQDVLDIPINRKLAQEITDYIQNHIDALYQKEEPANQVQQENLPEVAVK